MEAIRKSFCQTLGKRSCLGLVVRGSGGRVFDSRIVNNENIPLAFTADALACAQGIQLGLDLGINRKSMPTIEIINGLVEGCRYASLNMGIDLKMELLIYLLQRVREEGNVI
ncbi:hypothetical protein Godav_003912 [Gossypium davidsonii]|uniref:RNase H type-1 domain-containing protein n=1 Tax=Gossypium davidsonii TaxID=34287 RepID=A0A7J8SK30_GOSDV|nr:hypothetical protein [Gossypium davidsonii]